MGDLRKVLHPSATSAYLMKWELVCIIDFQSVTPVLLKGSINKFQGLGHGHVFGGWRGGQGEGNIKLVLMRWHVEPF